MSPTPPIHRVLLAEVQGCESASSRILPAPAMPPFVINDPDSLHFIDTLAGFHLGFLTAPTTARTPTLYSETAERFITLLRNFNRSAPHLMRDGQARDAYYEMEPAHSAPMYNEINLSDSYPIHNLVLKIAHCYQTIRSHPTPTFQTRFLVNLPVELLHMSISDVDDADVVAVAATCSRLRSVCINLRRLNTRVFMRLRCSFRSTRPPYPPSRADFYPDILEQMARARDDLSDLMGSISTNRACVCNARYLCVTNEWEHMWPPPVPTHDELPLYSVDRKIFQPLYDSLFGMISCLPLKHVRLVSMDISHSLVSHLADHPSLRCLTVDRYTSFPRFQRPPSCPTAANITFLAIGFHGSYITHRDQWRLMGVFPSLRHLYAYTTHITETDIRYPMPTADVLGVHELEVLHVQGSCQDIGELAAWLTVAAQMKRRPGSLRRVKIHSPGPIGSREVHRLVSVLGDFHPSLRILVLEGVHDVFPPLLMTISRRFRHLEGLSIVPRSPLAHRSDQLCNWNDVLAQYAIALSECDKLQHLEVNALWPTPELNSHLIPTIYGTLNGIHVYGNRPVRTQTHSILGPDEIPAAATFIARAFATRCPSLASFAIRAGICHFGCTILRRADADIVCSDVHCTASNDRFADWNPPKGATWSQDS